MIPPPAQVFVFVEEHQDSIDDGTFTVANDTYAPPDEWFDMASDRHNQGCNLSFADGHVQKWRWKAPKHFRQHQQRTSSRADQDDLYRLKAGIPGR